LLATTIRPTNTLLFLINEAGDAYVAYGDPTPETDVVFAEDSGVIRLLRQSDTTIYLQAGKPWPPELRVDRARLGIIRVMVIAKMVGTDQINGFVCIGAPLSQANTYNFEELRFISNLVGQLAVAIERDQVIRSLERRVRELDVLSQVGQAVNFTIERDDLIELISAQTLKLIPSPSSISPCMIRSPNSFTSPFSRRTTTGIPPRKTRSGNWTRTRTVKWCAPGGPNESKTTCANCARIASRCVS